MGLKGWGLKGDLEIWFRGGGGGGRGGGGRGEKPMSETTLWFHRELSPTNLCTKILYKNIVQKFCTKILYKNFVQKFYAKILYKNFVQLISTKYSCPAQYN